MEVVERLRRKGEPIRIFGESDKDCRLRLRALELLEEHDMTRKRLKKDAKSFEPMSGTESAEKPSDHDGKSTMEASDSSNVSTRTPARLREGIGMNSVMDLKLIWTDTPRVYPIIYYTLKGLLADWEEALSKRPDNVRNSAQGQQVTAMQAQTAEYLKPLFKSLRKRALEPDMLLRIAEIVHYMQLREYRKANDSYLQLSIGNAPWPIGITMAGLKRLMTFAQSHYPPDDLSKLMG
ncbi:pre-mrna splicing factor [Malassezia pachydermatis]|uniref:Pre-mRNA-splicing factor 18 n=1 Tax=Malassezia pachydermatis TaxID=77020 RepID=A0A0M8ML42_9BASI|nr:pre-mrna splicing factor [Malassezia pachydermatis]KOS13738.1 pre-mrna splicing factor [Malassezia pachydermatis]